MAHKKGLGSSRNGRDSESKRLGVKIFAGQQVKTGMIIVRQRGTKFRAGPGAGLGRDHTIFALREGTVEFRTSGPLSVVNAELAATARGDLDEIIDLSDTIKKKAAELNKAKVRSN